MTIITLKKKSGDNDVLFNYRLFKGRAVSRNAIKLLGVMGYDPKLIEKGCRIWQIIFLRRENGNGRFHHAGKNLYGWLRQRKS